jgi:hypothetical protein
MLATGNPEFPVRVAAVGTRKVLTDKQADGQKKTEYIRDVPEIVQLIAEFPSGMVMHITSSTVNETGTQELIRGHKGNITMGGNRVDLKPEKPFVDEIDADIAEGFKGEPINVHEANWFDCIRTGRTPNANIDLAVRVQTVISLAEMSDRLGEMVYFEEKSRKLYAGVEKHRREIKPLTYGTLELS